MSKAPRISLKLGSLKIGATVANPEPKPVTEQPAETSTSGFGSFGSFGKINPPSKPMTNQNTPSGFGKIASTQMEKATTSKVIVNEAVIGNVLPEPEKPEEMVVESTLDIARVMGFSGFGDSKKAKQFDMSLIFEEAKQKALDRNAANNLKLQEEGKACLDQEVVIHKFEKPR